MKRFQRDVMRRGEALAEVGGVFTNVPHIVTHHSPTGFEFGYGGSGPADLALNVCQAYLNMQDYRGRKSKCWDGECWFTFRMVDWRVKDYSHLYFGKKKPLIEMAKVFQGMAEAWNVKLPKNFMAQAETYQADFEREAKIIEKGGEG